MTIADLVSSLVTDDPSRPLVTFYDERTGERVELSTTTWANWVAKVASLLVEECDLERGDRLLLDLPSHWLGTVFAAAAWTAGLTVVPAGTDEESGPGAAADAVVCGPATLPRWAPHAERSPVLACALLPLGVRFTQPVPAGVVDVGVEVWSQPDVFVALDPATTDDEALPATTQGDLLARADADDRIGAGERLLTTAHLSDGAGLRLLAATLARRGSLVLVTGTDDPARVAALAEAEHARAEV